MLVPKAIFGISNLRLYTGDYDEDEDSSEHSDGGGESPRISRAGSQSPRRKTAANTAKQSLATENENRFKVPLLPARPSRFSSSSMTAIETENEKTELATTIVGDEGRSNNSRHNSLQFKDELTGTKQKVGESVSRPIIGARD